MDFIQALLHFCSKQQIQRGRGELPSAPDEPDSSHQTGQSHHIVFGLCLTIIFMIDQSEDYFLRSSTTCLFYKMSEMV